MPEATAQGRQVVDIGTNKSRTENSTNESAKSAAICNATANSVRKPSQRCRSRSQAGRSYGLSIRVANKTPQTTDAVNKPHATIPEALDKYHQKCGLVIAEI